MQIELKNVSFSYGAVPTLHDVSFSVRQGALVAVLGPNGAGKSTILKAMVGLIKPDSGQVSLGGIAPDQIAYLPQAAQIDRSLPVSVLDTVLTGAWRHTGAFGAVRPADKRAAFAALETVGLAEFAQRPVAALSSGQFQRVLFARILLQDAPLILLDEPFTAIDASTTFDLLQLVSRWRAEGRTVIAVLHDYEQVRAYFPYTLLLSKEVIAWGKTETVLTDAHLQRANANASHWHERAPVCHVDDPAAPPLSAPSAAPAVKD